MNDADVLSWRSLGDADLPALAGLARDCLLADGGQPFAADPGFLRGRYLDGAQARGGWQGPQLVWASALRRPGDGPDAAAVTTGLVHPQWRRRGLGGTAFDWAAGQARQPGEAGPAALTADTEALSDGAHALYLARGLSQVLARCGPVPAARLCPGRPPRPVRGRSLRSMTVYLFAGIPVRDFAAALAWYERLLGGPPSFFPHDTEAVWQLAEHRSVYVVQRPERAGHALLTLIVDDLDERVAGIAKRGLEPAGRETYPNGVRKITYADPEGNEIGFGEVPAE